MSCSATMAASSGPGCLGFDTRRLTIDAGALVSTVGCDRSVYNPLDMTQRFAGLGIPPAPFCRDLWRQAITPRLHVALNSPGLSRFRLFSGAGANKNILGWIFGASFRLKSAGNARYR